MRPRHTLLFLLSLIVILAGLAIFFPSDGFKIGSIHLRFPDLKTILTDVEVDDESAEEKLAIVETELRLQFVADSLNKLYRIDSLAYADTLRVFKNFIENSTARFYFPNDDPSLFDDLFLSLDKCSDENNGEVMHILHYGDSQIESDRITAYIREQFQQKFGGRGVGLLPAVQPIPSTTIVQSASDTILRYIADGSLIQKLDNNHYGILAQMAQLNGNVTLNFGIRNIKENQTRVRSFSNVSLLVGNTYKPFVARLKSGKINITKIIEKPSAELHKITWELDTLISSFSLHLSGDAEIYGVSTDGDYGVAVDNIPLRGSSGTFFTRISKNLLSSSMKNLNVQLIMMEFGGNAMPYINSDSLMYNYKKNISRQISYLRTVYPEADILFIGPADMSKKVKGVLQSYPNIEPMIECLKEAALENNAAFWSTYDVMGGRNSMIKWVSHEPAWASSDYVHFTRQGADRIADLFVQTFMIYYDYYQFLKRYNEWNEKDCDQNTLNKDENE